MPEQFSEKKRQAGSKDKKEPLCQGYSVPENTGAVGVKNFDSRYKTGVRTIECQKKAQRESKSKRIGIHTCFQASIETPDLDDVAVPNYQIQGWTLLSNQPGKSPGTCRCSSSCFFLTRSHIHVFEIVTMAPDLGTCSLFNRPPSFLLHLLPYGPQRTSSEMGSS